MIDVVQEGVERRDALDESCLENVPFRGRDDARNDVERNQALGAGILAVDREGDADAMEGALGFLAFLGDLFGRRCGPSHSAKTRSEAGFPVLRTHFVVSQGDTSKYSTGEVFPVLARLGPIESFAFRVRNLQKSLAQWKPRGPTGAPQSAPVSGIFCPRHG